MGLRGMAVLGPIVPSLDSIPFRFAEIPNFHPTVPPWDIQSIYYQASPLPLRPNQVVQAGERDSIA